MRYVLTSQRGNIAFAMAIVIMMSLSGIALLMVAVTDTSQTLTDCDMVQVFFSLRSGAARCKAVLDAMQGTHEGFYLPDKSYTVKGTHAIRNITVQNRVMTLAESKQPFEANFSGYRTLSLVLVKRGKSHLPYMSYLLPGSTGFGEEFVNIGNGLLAFMQFTDNDQSTNGTPVAYWGPDIIYGRVHSNTDIWVKQGGGGANMGWPTFYGLVSTSGQIQSYTGTPPYAQVFRSGFLEHAREIHLNSTALDIRTHGTSVGPTNYDPDRILFVNVQGAAFTSMIGLVYNSGPDTAAVWTHYPPSQGDYYLFRNRWTKYDTLWYAGPAGNHMGNSSMVYSKLWIKGTFHGAQTWCATDTIYLNNDILLANTPVGYAPDGSIPGSSVNRTDFVGIVSEKSILVQYGYKDPMDSLRHKPNCDGDDNGIWIYAALCALGDGQGNSHRDGVFSFEYQHPHPSITATRLPGSNFVWDKIDLHRRKYPQTNASPWPGSIDYPWYNPLWPESSPYKERGTIHLRGAVSQRRAGYLHRDLVDYEYPNPAGTWQIPLDFCGGPAGNSFTDNVLGINYSSVNAPYATGEGIGYKRDYRYDQRLDYNSPPDYPLVSLPGASRSTGWNIKKPPRNLTVLN